MKTVKNNLTPNFQPQTSYAGFPCTVFREPCSEDYYHTDHLGSSSWITDKDGDPVQFMHYLPFGETAIDQRATYWNSRYTFSGKEKDEETGYGYFGARYYDSDLSIWLSVDPLASKYPGWSPYVYCANNPIKLVDPDGRSFGDFYDFGGNYLGTDGEKDNKVYLLNENDVKDKITPKNANGVAGKIKVSTTYQELNEANEVYNRTTGNGGNKEECSVVLDEINVIKGPQGGDVSKGEKATTSFPSNKGENRTTSIHSHPLGEYSNNTYYAPESLSLNDNATFNSYGLNIVVGNSKPRINASTGNSERVPQVVFYNSNSTSLGKMNISALKNVIDNGKSRKRF
ncbi:RHS repeat-associated core domain-containing protein [Bacteroidales bacterium OttesenSCG-928-B11]|nr:RHS repeat-associated core domain-containing protein [Bacteroidales bacterium OttesenSCG-928-C03]MDL2311305.1 RHS repeat-associated core domain-containing protein [Bacteroidales bacterium OttesenSCG-928-B11]MDL2326031.1 RHS repeat-associated core domain-containing protein [Bacteroidales bacterium OttesenSCG-928-A14]